MAQVSPCVSFHVIHACALVFGRLGVSLHPSLYFFLKSFFHLFLMFTLVPDENSMEDPLCNSSFGSMVSLDYVTPDTCRTGTSASSAARAGTSCETERRRTRNSSSTLFDLFSIPNYYIKKGRPHGHRYGKKPGDHEYLTANSLKNKCKKRHFLVFHDLFHSNIVSSDKMPVRHRADFKQALTNLRQLKNQEDQAYYQMWQSSSSSWWDWQDSWWYSSSEHHRDDGPSTDRSGKPDGR